MQNSKCSSGILTNTKKIHMNLTAFVGVLFASLITLSLSAQPPGARKIAGKVFDQTSNNAVPGATITVKGTKNSVQADVNGEFATRTISVERRRLDQLPLEGRAVGVIKIDVEGHELSTLQGGTGLIARFMPSVLIESEARHHAGAPHNVFQFFRSFGYEGYFIHRRALRTIDEFSVEEFQSHSIEKSIDDRKSPDYINNFLFIHPSRRVVFDRVKEVFPMSASSVAVGAA